MSERRTSVIPQVGAGNTQEIWWGQISELLMSGRVLCKYNSAWHLSQIIVIVFIFGTCSSGIPQPLLVVSF